MLHKVYKETDDEWHGSYVVANKSAVKVLLSVTGPNPPYSGSWRVGVWGTDNYGLIKDFVVEGDAELAFQRLCKWDKVNKKDLLMYGFEVA